jgi:hypothetical protein
MKKLAMILCVGLLTNASSIFAIGETEFFYGTITAVNTGYYSASGTYCAVQVGTNEISGQDVSSSPATGSLKILLVQTSNPLYKEIYAALLHAQACGLKVHMSTLNLTLMGNNYNEIKEISVGVKWTGSGWL